MSITFTVPGTPAPQGSKRAFRNRHSDRIQLVESSKTVGPWRERVALAAHSAAGGRNLLDGPITVLIDFVMPRPKSAPKTRTPAAVKRPDVDKLARACLDALTSVIFVDDAQVTNLHVTKRLAEVGEAAHAHITVDSDD
jgi:crossover junction endodeoxyribonuclease RusA